MFQWRFIHFRARDSPFGALEPHLLKLSQAIYGAYAPEHAPRHLSYVYDTPLLAYQLDASGARPAAAVLALRQTWRDYRGWTTRFEVDLSGRRLVDKQEGRELPMPGGLESHIAALLRYVERRIVGAGGVDELSQEDEEDSGTAVEDESEASEVLRKPSANDDQAVPEETPAAHVRKKVKLCIANEGDIHTKDAEPAQSCDVNLDGHDGSLPTITIMPSPEVRSAYRDSNLDFTHPTPQDHPPAGDPLRTEQSLRATKDDAAVLLTNLQPNNDAPPSTGHAYPVRKRRFSLVDREYVGRESARFLHVPWPVHPADRSAVRAGDAVEDPRFSLVVGPPCETCVAPQVHCLNCDALCCRTAPTGRAANGDDKPELGAQGRRDHAQGCPEWRKNEVRACAVHSYGNLCKRCRAGTKHAVEKMLPCARCSVWLHSAEFAWCVGWETSGDTARTR